MRMLSLGELIDFFESIGSSCLNNSDMPVWDLNPPEILDDEFYEEPMPEMMDEPEDLVEDPEPDYDGSDLAPEEYLMDPDDLYEYINEEDINDYKTSERKITDEKEILELLNQLKQEHPDEKEILELLNQLEQEHPDEKEILELLDYEYLIKNT
ncbi:hypothetical protein [Methanothermobacter sp.]|uniref:hypothetical protein n=1 Tax=Methanothermobacter sp. TaxID=1884223 RepID=UPI003C7895F8